MLHTYVVDCPYCGENFETSLDPSVEQQEYIEDCQVCCSPIIFTGEFYYDTATEQNIPSVNIKRDNE